MFPIPVMITALAKDAFIAEGWAVVGRKVSKPLVCPQPSNIPSICSIPTLPK